MLLLLHPVSADIVEWVRMNAVAVLVLGVFGVRDHSFIYSFRYSFVRLGDEGGVEGL